MLIDEYDLEVFTLPCKPGSERLAARARFISDIKPVLPYLNGTLQGARYNPTAPALIWKRGGLTIAFHPFEIAISKVEDRHEAETKIQGFVDLANHTWERRGDLQPMLKARKRPTPLGVYKLLPGTNCKGCGESTCYNFALKLTAGKVNMALCPVLGQPGNRAAQESLTEILADAPSIEGREV